MTRGVQRLSARGAAALGKAGYYPDGAGLYLQVAKGGSKSWILRYTRAGRSREMGLGSFQLISLAEARDRAKAGRKLLLDGTDPIEERRRAYRDRQLAEASAITFRRCAEGFIEAHAPGWRNAKHCSQWRATMASYAYPLLADLPVDAIETAHVMRVLEPIWSIKTETASRVRGRVEAILDWAAARGYRRGENPARWRGHLDHLLPNRAKVQRVVHHPALPYAEVPAFLLLLRQQAGLAAKALDFQILTAARTGEVLGATWDEFDMTSACWTVPGMRMKAGRDHRVPLSREALAIVTGMAATMHSTYVFPGLRDNKSLSNMSLLQLLKRMARSDITAHGFRSSFRDWASEATNHPQEVAELALAHTIRDKVEAAYRRGDLFAKRRQLMQDWSEFCGSVIEPGRQDLDKVA